MPCQEDFMTAWSKSSCRVRFPCVLLTPVSVQVLLPEGHGSDQCPFSIAKINGVRKVAVPGEVEVLETTTGNLGLKSLLSGGVVTHRRSDLGRDSRMLMDHAGQQLSEEGIPATALEKFSLFPRTAQQDDTSWPSPRCTGCPFMSWATGELSQGKPAEST